MAKLLLHVSVVLLSTLAFFTTLPLISGATSDSDRTTQPLIIITFFMHDILGGSSPSERIVAGTTILNFNNNNNNNLPVFAKPNNRIFPRGTPTVVDYENANIINGGSTIVISDTNTHNNVVINERDNKNDMLPYVKPGILPLGATILDNVVFGRVTVIDYEVTQGSDLWGSRILGKAYGFHLATSMDGSSKTMAFTVAFNGDDDEKDGSISFFGVHRTAAIESSIAVVGGTGKYANAKGYAKLETLPLSRDNQQLTSNNGLHTVLLTTVYLTP